jgi:hypothetical protein
MRPASEDRRADERPRGARELGQASVEYLGVLVAGAVLVLALVVVAPGIGSRIAEEIECAVAKITGGQCERDRLVDTCPLGNSTRTDSFSAGVSLKVVSLGGEQSRVILKEEFADGSARYTVIDRTQLEVALGERGGGARFLGSQGSLTAGLAAIGALEHADIYETENAEQTAAIDEALSDPNFAENIIRSGGEVQDAIIDSPVDAACGLGGLFGVDCPDARPSDLVPNPSEMLADLVFGGQDLPEPTSEYVGGELGLQALANAISDRGGLPGSPGSVDEVGLEGELKVAGGARVFTDGDREGETELYYLLEGSAQGELEDSFLGTLNGGARGQVTATVTIGADGRPKTLTLNATGTLTGEENLGGGELTSGGDISELLADRDSLEGKTYEVVAEVDLSDPSNLLQAGRLLSTSPSDQLSGANGLVDVLRDDAEIRVATYDTTIESTQSGIDVVVANVGGSRTDQQNTLESLYVKPRGSLNFTKTPCGTDGAG